MIGTGYIPGGTTTSTPTISAYGMTPGATYRIRASGYYSTTATPNATITFSLGGTSIGTSTAPTLGAAVSNQFWTVDFDFVCVSIGSSGTVQGQGLANFFSTSNTLSIPAPIVTTSATTINTTISQAINVTWTWSAASASDTATCTNLTISRVF